MMVWTSQTNTNIPLYFFLALGLRLRGKLSLTRIAVALSLSCYSHTFFSVLQGALDVLQGPHTFHLSPENLFTIFPEFSWSGCLMGTLSLLASFPFTHFACFLFLFCGFSPSLAACSMPFITCDLVLTKPFSGPLHSSGHALWMVGAPRTPSWLFTQATFAFMDYNFLVLPFSLHNSPPLPPSALVKSLWRFWPSCWKLLSGLKDNLVSAEYKLLFIFPQNILSLRRERINFQAECHHLRKYIQPMLE